MNIIVKYEGIKLIKKYGLFYIRFKGKDDIPCDLKITDDEAKTIIDNPKMIKEIRNVYKSKISWTEEYFVNSFLKDYFLYELALKENRIEPTIKKLNRHEDIKFELYETIIYDSFPKSSAIKVCGYTAKKLKEETKLNILGVYNYLIYLREDKENALKNLQSGLIVK